MRSLIDTSRTHTNMLDSLADIVGRAHVLTTARETTAYTQGNRYGAGRVLAVIRPGTLVECWAALQLCVDHDLIVIPQASNTSLTGGSGPGDQPYDREVVIFSTTRIDAIHLVNDAREAVCLAGSTLQQLEETLLPHRREPHSVIGSSSIGASVVGGIANNSGGSQIRKGPAFTTQAIYARVTDRGRLELVNHLGIELGGDPIEMLTQLQHGAWGDGDVSPPPPEATETAYGAHVREMADSPARYNADPNFLHEASGSAGKIMIFAVRTQTFPLISDTTTFYIGTNHPADLEDLRREILSSPEPLPISGEYLGRSAFDLAERYGKDTYLILRWVGAQWVRRLFAFKEWANGVFARIPSFGDSFVDVISQRLSALLPAHLPRRMRGFRSRFEHHLILVVERSDQARTSALLTSLFREAGRDGAFFTCTPKEARAAMLHRFGAASAMTRYSNMRHKRGGGMITFDVALRRNDDDWLEVLPSDIAEQLEVSTYYGHFFCHVLHQDHIAKQGADVTALRERMLALLEDRGAAVPAEHNYGRLYQLPPTLEEHFKDLDPRNVFNAGIGGTSPRRNWE